MRKGKMIAQGCHAAVNAIVNNITDDRVKTWLGSNYAKICVSVYTEEELLQIFKSAIRADIIAELVVDSGLTEFHGIKTNTCVALGPEYSDIIDILTKNLKLL